MKTTPFGLLAFGLGLVGLSACATPERTALSARAQNGDRYAVTGESDEDIFLMAYHLCKKYHENGFEIVRAPQPDVLKVYPGLRGVVRCTGKVDSELKTRYDQLPFYPTRGPDPTRTYFQRIPPE